MYFENQGNNTYLVYAIQPEDEIDSMSLGMITNNDIPGLAQTVFMQMDSNRYIKFNVSSKISVKQFFEGSVNKKRLLGVFTGIVNAVLSAEEYMIDIDSIIFDLDYIFSDVSSCDTVLICLPTMSQNKNCDLSNFFKTIMFSTQFDQTENCDYVAKIINFLNSAASFSVTDFKKVLDSLNINDSSKNTTERSSTSSSSAVTKPNSTSVQPNAQPQQTIIYPQPTPSLQLTPQNRVSAAVNNPNGVKHTAKATPQKQYTPQPEVEINDDERISLMYLMQHYNKENAAKYKAQKAAKKASISQAAQNTVMPKNKKAKNNTSSTSSHVGFSIPGQSVPAAQVQTPIQPKVQSQQVNIPQSQVNQQPKVVPTVPQPVQPTCVPHQTTQGQSANFGETTVLGGVGIGETTVLGVSTQENQVTPHLIRTKNNERINLNKPVFRIGKERSYVDYFVSDNTAVSRSHANIITRDDKYFIVDTNSTNHTYVNGGMIQSNVETPLSHGTKIRLANEDFEFRLY